MRTRRYLLMALALGSLLLSSVAGAQVPRKGSEISAQESVTASLSNTFVRVDAAANGQFVIGTTGGDPAIAVDNDKRLLYGFYANGSSSIWSSKTLVRVADSATPVDYLLNGLGVTVSQPTAQVGSTLVTTWTLPSIPVAITQTLSLMRNPFSGRDDMVRIEYTVANGDSVAHTVGVRCMLDVMVGDNDAAPYFVPGVGNSGNELQFGGLSIPPYYYSFESSTFAADSLKGQGILSGFGLTAPDLFQIASWTAINGLTTWEYTINPAASTGDSATVMYYNPRTVAPGTPYSVATAYGLAGQGGGAAWTTAPVILPVDVTSFQVTAWISNTTGSPFTGGQATLQLPVGLSLPVGPASTNLTASEIATKAIGDVAPGAVAQVTWTVDITGGQGTYSYSVVSHFTSGTADLTSQGTITVGAGGSVVFIPMAKMR